MPTHRILYLESDLEFQKLLKNRFTEAGFEVYACVTVAEGLEVCAKIDPHLLILGAEMQNGDAFDFLTALFEKNSAYQSLPALILSDFPEDERAPLAAELAHCQYLERVEESLEDILAKAIELLND